MKKIATIGCSFTWGQGLWYYHDTNEYVPTTYEYLHNVKKIPQSSLDFKDKNNWPGLVSSHFNTSYMMKSWNGGTDHESIQFINTDVFDKNEDIEWLIFQTTQLYRSPFEFEVDGKKYIVKSEPDKENLAEINLLADGHYDGLHVPQKDFGKFFDWAHQNKINPAKFCEMNLLTVMDNIENVLKKCEERGIKTAILCWTEEYLTEIIRRKFLTDRFIRLNYNGYEYSHIDDLQQKNPQLFIAKDTSKLHKSGDGFPSTDDWHPSLDCHKIIADNVINFIKEYE